MVSSLIGTRLRGETLTAHASIEQAALATGFMTALPAYVSYLRRLYGFYLGIERALCASSELSVWLPDVASRQKAALLKADLLALGDSPAHIDALAACEVRAHLPAIDTSAVGLGASYVVEGSTLGGRFIVSRLVDAIPLGARSFFDGYGSRTGIMWRAFGEALVRHCDATGHDDHVIDAAVATFHMMEQWIVGESP
jgi:heme oxygenase